MTINKDQSEATKNISRQPSTPTRPTSKWSEVKNTLADIKQTFGFVPTFINNLVDQSLPGAWNEVKNLRFGSDTALNTKLKGLIGLAVSSQIPCEMISYFDENATSTDGATRQEQHEAVLMAAMSRHWSTVLNGSQIDKDEFRTEVDRVMANIKKMMEESHMQSPPEDMFLVMPKTADEAYKDIEKTLGLVPKFFLVFPKEGIAGAWSEFKGLQLNPHTALDSKQKELIGLAVAAQIPCDYCVYFHRAAAILFGASQREMQEAVSLAALARHWSTLFHGPQIDPATFTREAEKMIQASSQGRLQS